MTTNLKFILLLIAFALVVLLFVMYVVFVKLRDGEKDKHLQQLSNDVKRLSKSASQTRIEYNDWLSQIQILYNQAESERKLCKKYQQDNFDANLYSQFLCLNDRQKFYELVNHKLNLYYDRLISDFPEMSDKESYLTLLYLLHIPDNVICILLEYSPNSLPTVKNRLCKKLNLQHAQDLQAFLENRLD